MRSDAFEREELIMKTFSCRSQRSIAFNRVTIFPQPAIVIQWHHCFPLYKPSHFPPFPPFSCSASQQTSASHRMLLLSLLKAKENQISPLNHSYFNGKQLDIKIKGGGKGRLEMERIGGIKISVSKIYRGNLIHDRQAVYNGGEIWAFHREVARAHSTWNNLLNDISLCSSWSPGLATGREEKHNVADAKGVLTAAQRGDASPYDP